MNAPPDTLAALEAEAERLRLRAALATTEADRKRYGIALWMTSKKIAALREDSPP